MSEENTSGSLEGTLDKGIDVAMSAKSIYSAEQGLGTAAAEIGASTAAGAASAGSGAAVGTAVGGPIGTALGAVAGLAAGAVAKPIIKAIIVIVVFCMLVFSQLPSIFWENPIDVADNTGPLETYTKYKSYVNEQYLGELEKRKQNIRDDFQRRKRSGEFNDYDHVDYSYSFVPSESAFLLEVIESCSLIISMFEVQQDDWRKASFNDFKSAVDSVNFWNDTISCTKTSEELDVTYDDDDESTLHINMVYTLKDVGVEAFRSKFGLSDDSQYIKAVEMSYNTRLYFGEVDELPMGGVIGGTGGTGSYPGGSTHNAIRQALSSLQAPREFFGGSVIIPLPSGTWHTTSEFGPRNYAPDPLHTGLDFAAAAGTPIYSAMDGVVLLRLTNMRSFGNHIVIYHGGNITTMYAHMSAFGSFNVGDSVRKGDVIGYVGATGLSEGNHLHFEYQKSGAASDPRNILPI